MITLNKYMVKQNEPLLLVSQLCEISIKTALKFCILIYPVFGIFIFFGSQMQKISEFSEIFALPFFMLQQFGAAAPIQMALLTHTPA